MSFIFRQSLLFIDIGHINHGKTADCVPPLVASRTMMNSSLPPKLIMEWTFTSRSDSHIYLSLFSEFSSTFQFTHSLFISGITNNLNNPAAPTTTNNNAELKVFLKHFFEKLVLGTRYFKKSLSSIQLMKIYPDSLPLLAQVTSLRSISFSETCCCVKEPTRDDTKSINRVLLPQDYQSFFESLLQFSASSQSSESQQQQQANQRPPVLENLMISHHKILLSEHLQPLAKFTNLRNLNLTSCSGLKDFSFLKDLTLLRELYVSWIPGFTDSQAVHLENLTILEKFWRITCERDSSFTDLGVSYLRNMPKMKDVNLVSNDAITDACLRNTFSQLKNLKLLNVTYCSNLSCAGKDELEKVIEKYYSSSSTGSDGDEEDDVKNENNMNDDDDAVAVRNEGGRGGGFGGRGRGGTIAARRINPKSGFVLTDAPLNPRFAMMYR